MNADTSLTSTPTGEIILTEADRDAMVQFQNALDTCVNGWHSGDDTVALPTNIQGLFGDMLLQYFERSLIEQVGQPVAFTFLGTGDVQQTFVQMPKNEKPNVLQTKTSEQATSNTDTIVAGPKKAPRPMNCWIIFRDAMHKQLKSDSPHLTVQQISTKCSQMWHNLPPAEKKQWQAAAKSAKDEHLRLHPDYKYSPRKPGEKKKRQSRKAKRAVAVQTEVFEFQSITQEMLFAPEASFMPAIVADNVTTDLNNTFVNDDIELAEPAMLLGTDLQQQQEQQLPVEYLHDSESHRQAHLEAEFSADFEMHMPFDMFGDEAFAFRAGADGNATLPSIYSDTY